jgi:tRNA threonylcarbamoyladenosine biosynthesis protein TsaE
MSESFVFDGADERATARLGAALAQSLPGRAVVGLIGPLGAGKTRLVQTVAEAAGVDRASVASPTFVLVHEYDGQVPIYHFDAYRLSGDDEFLALGAEEYFAQEGWCFVEWADRVQKSLPADRLEIAIEPTTATARRFTIRALGACGAILQDLQMRTENSPAES